MMKRYGVIITWFNIRAVHLETGYTLNTDSCTNVVRRFIARRGVKVIKSDNRTNLVRAERELWDAVQSLNNKQIQAVALKKCITWLFNPPAGSHREGVWEKQIRTIRQIINALLHQQILDDEGLATNVPSKLRAYAIAHCLHILSTQENPCSPQNKIQQKNVN